MKDDIVTAKKEQCLIRKIAKVLSFEKKFQDLSDRREIKEEQRRLEEMERNLDLLYKSVKVKNAEVEGHFLCGYAYLFKSASMIIRKKNESNGSIGTNDSLKSFLIHRNQRAPEQEVKSSEELKTDTLIKGTIGVDALWWDEESMSNGKSSADQKWLVMLDEKMQRHLNNGAKIDRLQWYGQPGDDVSMGTLQKHVLCHVGGNRYWTRYLKGFGVQGLINDKVELNVLGWLCSINHTEQLEGLLWEYPHLADSANRLERYPWMMAVGTWNPGSYERVLMATSIDVLSECSHKGVHEKILNEAIKKDFYWEVWERVLAQKQRAVLESDSTESVKKRKESGARTGLREESLLKRKNYL